MTYEELCAEAKKQGYRLIKKKKYVPHVRCRCGRRGLAWQSQHGIMIKCDQCESQSGWHRVERDAWVDWYNVNSDEKWED